MTTGVRQCDHHTLPRRRGGWLGNRLLVPGRRCPNPARYHVLAAPRRASGQPGYSVAGEWPCGLHVRPYLMDNGDGARAPWLVERLPRPRLKANATPWADLADPPPGPATWRYHPPGCDCGQCGNATARA